MQSFHEKTPCQLAEYLTQFFPIPPRWRMYLQQITVQKVCTVDKFIQLETIYHPSLVCDFRFHKTQCKVSDIRFHQYSRQTATLPSTHFYGGKNWGWLGNLPEWSLSYASLPSNALEVPAGSMYVLYLLSPYTLSENCQFQPMMSTFLQCKWDLIRIFKMSSFNQSLFEKGSHC